MSSSPSTANRVSRCHPYQDAQVLVRHSGADPTSPGRRPPAVDSGCARVSELRRRRARGSTVLPGLRARAGERASAAGAPQGRDGRLLRPLRLDRARGAPRSRDAAARDRVVLRRDERRRSSATRARSRSSSATRSWPCSAVPAVREDDALRAVRAAADMRAALAELNEELEPALRGHAPDAHRRQHRPGDRRRPRARRGLRQRGRRQRRRPPPAGGDARGDPHRRADARARQPGRHRRAGPAVGAQGQEPAGPCLQAARGRRRRRGSAAGGYARRSSAATASCSVSRLPSRGRSTATAASWSRSSAPPASASRGSPATSRSPSASEAAVAVGRCLSYGEGLASWPLREVVTAIAGSADGATAPTRCGPGSRACWRATRTRLRSWSASRAPGAGRSRPPRRWRPPGRSDAAGGGRVRASAGGRPRGRPLGRARPPRPDRARRRVAGGRAGADRRAGPTRPARRQARLRRRRAATGAGAARAATTAACSSSTCSGTAA